MRSRNPKVPSFFGGELAWRSIAGCAMRAMSDGQVQAAELFEDFLLKPQLALLRRLFPAAEEWSSCLRTTPCRIDACLRAAPPPWRRRCFPLRTSSNLCAQRGTESRHLLGTSTCDRVAWLPQSVKRTLAESCSENQGEDLSYCRPCGQPWRGWSMTSWKAF